jgi:hypothetical protein
VNGAPVINTKDEAFRRQTTRSNGLRAAPVDEPMAQLHGCAMPIGKFFGSAERLGARAQGVVRVNVRRQKATYDHKFNYARSAYEGARISR